MNPPTTLQGWPPPPLSASSASTAKPPATISKAAAFVVPGALRQASSTLSLTDVLCGPNSASFMSIEAICGIRAICKTLKTRVERNAHSRLAINAFRDPQDLTGDGGDSLEKKVSLVIVSFPSDSDSRFISTLSADGSFNPFDFIKKGILQRAIDGALLETSVDIIQLQNAEPSKMRLEHVDATQLPEDSSAVLVSHGWRLIVIPGQGEEAVNAFARLAKSLPVDGGRAAHHSPAGGESSIVHLMQTRIRLVLKLEDDINTDAWIDDTTYDAMTMTVVQIGQLPYHWQPKNFFALLDRIIQFEDPALAKNPGPKHFSRHGQRSLLQVGVSKAFAQMMIGLQRRIIIDLRRNEATLLRERMTLRRLIPHDEAGDFELEAAFELAKKERDASNDKHTLFSPSFQVCIRPLMRAKNMGPVGVARTAPAVLHSEDPHRQAPPPGALLSTSALSGSQPPFNPSFQPHSQQLGRMPPTVPHPQQSASWAGRYSRPF